MNKRVRDRRGALRVSRLQCVRCGSEGGRSGLRRSGVADGAVLRLGKGDSIPAGLYTREMIYWK